MNDAAETSDLVLKTKFLRLNSRPDLESEIKKDFPGAFFTYIYENNFNWSVIVFETTEDRTLYLLKYGKNYV